MCLLSEYPILSFIYLSASKSRIADYHMHILTIYTLLQTDCKFATYLRFTMYMLVRAALRNYLPTNDKEVLGGRPLP